MVEPEVGNTSQVVGLVSIVSEATFKVLQASHRLLCKGRDAASAGVPTIIGACCSLTAVPEVTFRGLVYETTIAEQQALKVAMVEYVSAIRDARMRSLYKDLVGFPLLFVPCACRMHARVAEIGPQ